MPVFPPRLSRDTYNQDHTRVGQSTLTYNDTRNIGHLSKPLMSVSSQSRSGSLLSRTNSLSSASSLNDRRAAYLSSTGLLLSRGRRCQGSALAGASLNRVSSLWGGAAGSPGLPSLPTQWRRAIRRGPDHAFTELTGADQLSCRAAAGFLLIHEHHAVARTALRHAIHLPVHVPEHALGPGLDSTRHRPRLLAFHDLSLAHDIHAGRPAATGQHSHGDRRRPRRGLHHHFGHTELIPTCRAGEPVGDEWTRGC